MDRQGVGGGASEKHSGAWKTVEGTEERKTVAKLLQFFQTAAQPSAIAARGRRFLPAPQPSGGYHNAIPVARLFCSPPLPARLALSSANSEIKSGRNEIRGERARVSPRCRCAESAVDASRSFGCILENFKHRIMPKCSRNAADTGLLLHREFWQGPAVRLRFPVSSRGFVC